MLRVLCVCLLIAAVPQVAPAAQAPFAPGQAPTDEDGKASAAAAREKPDGAAGDTVKGLSRAALMIANRPLPAGLEGDGDFLAELVQEATEPQHPQYELSLLEAIELALRHNLQVQVSRYNQDLSFEGIDAARATFDPVITFNVPSTFQRRTSPATTQTEGADILTAETFAGGLSFRETLEWGTSWQVNWSGSRSVSNNEFQFNNPTLSSNLSFNVTQPLLRGFGSVNRTNILVAENSYEGSREQFRSQVQQVLLNTYNSYWGLVGQIRAVQVRRDALDLALQQLRRNQIQVEIGTLAPIETVQAERSAENARLTLIQQQNALANQEDALKELLNLQAVLPNALDVEIVPTSEPEYSTAPIDVEQAIAIALENDPTLRQQRLSLESDRLNLRAARNNQLPRVDLSVGVNLDGRAGDRLIRGDDGNISEIQKAGFGQALEQILSGDFNTWGVGLTVSFPIHNYSADAQYARATIGERQRLVSIGQLEQQIVFNVRNAARNVESGARQVETARETTRLSERQLAAEQRKFEVGTSTNFQVLTFQDQLANSQLSEIQAVIDYLQSRAALELSKGTLLEYFGVSMRQAGTGRR